jgi:hypothetical protein
MGRFAGSSGWMAAQISSGTSCSAMVGVVMAAHHPQTTHHVVKRPQALPQLAGLGTRVIW